MTGVGRGFPQAVALLTSAIVEYTSLSMLPLSWVIAVGFAVGSQHDIIPALVTLALCLHPL